MKTLINTYRSNPEILALDVDFALDLLKIAAIAALFIYGMATI